MGRCSRNNYYRLITSLMGMHAEDAQDDSIDMEIHSFEINERQKLLSEGIHVDLQGQQISLKEMSNSHLKNCIKYFGLFEHSPYHEELENRGIYYSIIP